MIRDRTVSWQHNMVVNSSTGRQGYDRWDLEHMKPVKGRQTTFGGLHVLLVRMMMRCHDDEH